MLEKHRREVAEQIKQNQNSLKKFEREQEEQFDYELKHFQQDRTKQYKNEKETLKRVRPSCFFVSKNFAIFRKF